MRTGSWWASSPLRYAKVDTTDIEGAPREEVFRRMTDGEVTVGKAYSDEQDLAVGDTLKLEGPSGTRRARIAGIVETVVFGGQTVGMSLETMEHVYGTSGDSAARAQGDLGGRPAGAAAQGPERSSRRTTRTSRCSRTTS